METSDEHEGTYGLVMPFVVCKSQGGPYDDASFVDGWTCGEIDASLRFNTTSAATLRWQVDPKLLPQLDLLAMHHGYTMTSEPWDEHPDEWTTVTFEKALAAPEAV